MSSVRGTRFAVISKLSPFRERGVLDVLGEEEVAGLPHSGGFHLAVKDGAVVARRFVPEFGHCSP
jgi:hypothetical protein